MDNNVITAAAVAMGTAVTALVNYRRDKQKFHREQQRHVELKERMDMQGRKLADVDNKLSVASVQGEDILSRMLTMNSSVAPSDIAKVLLEMRKSQTDLERYAHKNVHRINNCLQILGEGREDLPLRTD